MGFNGRMIYMYALAMPNTLHVGWGRSGSPNNLLKNNIKLLWGEIHVGAREIPGPPINVL